MFAVKQSVHTYIHTSLHRWYMHSCIIYGISTFLAPNSFTGEDMVEFQVHGGPSVVLALVSALGRMAGCRQAEPGDFTKRYIASFFFSPGNDSRRSNLYQVYENCVYQF